MKQFQNFTKSDQSKHGVYRQHQTVIGDLPAAPVSAKAQTQKGQHQHQQRTDILESPHRSPDQSRQEQPAIGFVQLQGMPDAVVKALELAALGFLGIEEDIIVKVDGVKLLQRIVIPEVYRYHSGNDSQTHEKCAYGLKQFLPLPSPAQIPDNDKNRKTQIEAQHGVLDPQQNTRPNAADHRFSKG